MKVVNLTGEALDLAVARVQGFNDQLEPLVHWLNREGAPAREWDVGGPIIERENFTLHKTWDGGQPRTGNDAWLCQLDFHDQEANFGKIFAYGKTPLEAAMRCFVLLKLGPEIEI